MTDKASRDCAGTAAGGPPPKLRMRAKLRPRVRVNMSSSNWFDLEAEFVSEDQSVDLGAVRLFLESGRKFIPSRTARSPRWTWPS